MNKEEAVKRVLNWMAQEEWSHGALLSVELRTISGIERWEVELAYAGLNASSPTTDPPSIVFGVRPDGTIEHLTLM